MNGSPPAATPAPARPTLPPRPVVAAPKPAASAPPLPLPASPPTRPLWPVVAAGLLLAAGVLHLILLPAHLAEARGLGLYFCAIGAAQVAWGLLFVVRPTEWTRRFGFSLLAVSPIALFVLTRLLRAPWSDEPEALDFIGVATVALELLAAVGLYLPGAVPAPRRASGRAVAMVAVLVLVGLAVGAASYGAGLAAEGIDWLSEGESEHGAHDEHATADPGTGATTDAAHSHAGA